ncbi:CAP domain-containing protein [Lutibacter sp. TH_r2]|uniref:CAP domain-containing protein n=1 Tax=Lutibacter sp. TH_r2 TaxID=3082083 RepID=UPI0029533D26|nr:CAP domain-containing protein [Lutibacter sp. TH_r2]MDV7186959.1 CAP domain-containing protein [Lutibacter sp. TH_r2]
MKSFIFKLFPLLFLSLFIISCASDNDMEEMQLSESTTTTTQVETVTYTSLESDVLDLVNSHRTSMGLNELQILNLISSVAEDHTKYMIENGQISHDNFSERANILMQNANAKSVGENVAFGYTTAEDVFNGWLNSESHRAAIEKSSFTHMGISTECNSNGKNYYTNIFIKK